MLQDYISDVANWYSYRRLQLNAKKTELIWFGTRHFLNKATENDLTLRLDSGPVHPVTITRNVTLDSVKQHVTKVASSEVTA